MKFRNSMKITGRISSVTNSFVQAIIPDTGATDKEVADMLAILGMSPHNKSCVYCGSPATDWDHLRPLVRGKKPSGYLNELRNRVPACGRCNQSKSGQDWERWINSNARGSPRTRKVADLDERIARLKKFEQWGSVQPLQLSALIPPAQWKHYWYLLEQIEEKMREAQGEAEKIRSSIMQAIKNPPLP